MIRKIQEDEKKLVIPKYLWYDEFLKFLKNNLTEKGITQVVGRVNRLVQSKGLYHKNKNTEMFLKGVEVSLFLN